MEDIKPNDYWVDIPACRYRYGTKASVNPGKSAATTKFKNFDTENAEINLSA